MCGLMQLPVPPPTQYLYPFLRETPNQNKTEMGGGGERTQQSQTVKLNLRLAAKPITVRQLVNVFGRNDPVQLVFLPC